ncbi:uncharacterized protein LOC109610505 isoform X2 [Camponotus floridanus]|uniref:uncharacterized protein LOC112637621 isoform X2 n=1 Tax=Camponotus floridanus TaxID=104421 RepID=UPI000DC6ACA3|nr:uncharacterized protein LOC112637621 isoform X2 [Camponotus floridanus]XP_025268463.1 uncharacterized protein LOC109610505 isoform X2 [Camponotus floridanus]
MHAIEERYYKINRIILKTLGLWPYQQSYLTQIHKILFAGILWTFILVQLLVFITTQYNINLLLKILSLVFPTLFGTIKYILFIIQADSVKQLLEQVRNDWRLLKNKLEIDIIEKYACNSRLFTMIVMAFCLLGVIFCTIFQLLPMILDIIIPLNKSRPCQIIAVTEYFINQEKYIYAILLHEIITVLIIAITIFGTGATIMMYILHACALFEVARRERFLYRRIVHAVVIHRRAIEFTEFLTSTFMVSYAILIIVGISSLSFNLFQFLQMVTLTNNINEAFIFGIFIITHLIYLFFANCAGQEITDHGIKFFKATYNGLWYAAPLHTQKLLLFVMRKGKINVTIGCGSLFIASLEGFAMLTNTAVSYFTVIYSTR